jgi:hypothetical protein
MSVETGSTGPDLWFLTPPGWIELVAIADEEEAARWFGELLDRTPQLFERGKTRAELLRTYRAVWQQVHDSPVDSAGALVTTLLDGTATIWQFTLRIVDLPATGDVNPMAVLERFLAAEQGPASDVLGPEDITETFRTEDGRDGVAIHATSRLGRDGETLPQNVSGADPAALGVVYAAVRLDRSPGTDADRLLLVTGVAPTVGERLAMALVAAQLTVSAQLGEPGSGPLPGRVDLDTTGRYRGRRSGGT